MMSKVFVQVKVKFRAFGITFGKIDETASFQLPTIVPSFDRVILDERGVWMRVWV